VSEEIIRKKKIGKEKKKTCIIRRVKSGFLKKTGIKKLDVTTYQKYRSP
jgi:hypothetical protein